MNPLINALTFLIQVFFDVYIFILMLRFLAQKNKVHYFNPIVQLLIKSTQFVVGPLRRLIPSFKGYDFSIIFLLFILQLLELFLIIFLRNHLSPKVGGLFLMAFAETGNKFINLYILLIILQAVLSWLPHLQLNPISEVVQVICRPIFQVVHRFIPVLGGLDFSPVIIIIVLFLLKILITQPLYQWGAVQALRLL